MYSFNGSKNKLGYLFEGGFILLYFILLYKWYLIPYLDTAVKRWPNVYTPQMALLESPGNEYTTNFGALAGTVKTDLEFL